MILCIYKMIITSIDLECRETINLDRPILNAKSFELKMLSFKVGWFNTEEVS